MKYEISLNDPFVGDFFLMLAATGAKSVGLCCDSFTEVVRKPDNTAKELAGESYTELEYGYYGLNIPADFFDELGIWKIRVNPEDAGVTFEGNVYICVCECNSKIREL